LINKLAVIIRGSRCGRSVLARKWEQFIEFLTRRFPESRRKADYLISVLEHIPPQARKDLKEVGWTKGLE
jgi:hypothetical protein